MSTIRLKVILKPPPPPPCTIADNYGTTDNYSCFTTPPLPAPGNNYTFLHFTYPEF